MRRIHGETPSKLHWITALLALVIAGLCGLSGVMLIDLRREAWTNDIKASTNLLNAEADDISRTIAIYDLSMRSTAAALLDKDVRQAPPRLQQMSLFDQTVTAPYFGAIRILDSNGVVTHDSGTLQPAPPTPAELDALRHHRDLADRKLFISKPLDRGQTSDISLSYRMETPEGAFSGIVIGTIQLAYFNDLFHRLSLGPRDVVSLFNVDGTMLAHLPVAASSVGRNISGSEPMRHFDQQPGGVFQARSVLDGEQRTYNFTHLDGLPLLLDVGLSTRDIYASWRQKAFMILIPLLTMALVAAGLVMTLRRELQRRLVAEWIAQTSEARYRLLADNASDVIMRFDRDLIRTYVSPSCRVYGYRPEELVGGAPKDWVHPEDWAQVAAMIAFAQSALKDMEVTYRILRKNGSYCWVEGRYSYVPTDGGFIAVLRDISRRKAAEIQLEAANTELRHLAAIDGLTGLANRRRFDEALNDEWRRACREVKGIALLVIDVDRFKAYNDCYGHQAGDEALKDVSRAMQAAISRPGDLAARYGGEEFAIILPNTDLYGAIEVAEQIRRGVMALRLPHIGTSEGIVSISVGVSSALPEIGVSNAAALFTLADQALYAAKLAGRNQVQAMLMARSVAE